MTLLAKGIFQPTGEGFPIRKISIIHPLSIAYWRGLRDVLSVSGGAIMKSLMTILVIFFTVLSTFT
jgi:hypothetical protein